MPFFSEKFWKNLKIFTTDTVFPSFPEEYCSLCVSLGRPVSLTRGGRKLTGIAAGIAPDGALLVQTQEGEKIAVTSGEVVVQGFYGEKL